MNANIKAIIKTKGWEDIKEAIQQEIDSFRIDTQLDTVEIGNRYLAKVIAEEVINTVINRIEAEDIAITKKIYK